MSVFCYGFRSVSACTFLWCSDTVSVRRKKYLKLRVISETRFRNSVRRSRSLQQIWMYSQGPQIDPDVVSWCLQFTFTASTDSILPSDQLSAAIQVCHPDESSRCLLMPESDWTSWPCSGKNGTVPGKFTSCGAQCLLLQTGRGVIIKALGKEGAEVGWNSMSLHSTECRMCVCLDQGHRFICSTAPLCHQMSFSKLNRYYCRYYSDNWVTLIALMETIHSIKPPDGKFTKLIN